MKLIFVLLSFFLCISCKDIGTVDNSKARLSSLILVVDGEECEIKPTFSSDQFEYEASCNGDDASLLAYPIYPKAKVQDIVKTPSNVVVGKQQLSIKVIAEDGASCEYKVNLNKSPKFSQMVLVPIPEGGIDVPLGIDDKGKRETDIKPIAKITRKFEIGKYEVTWKLWKAVYDWAKDNGYIFKKEAFKGGKEGEAFGTPAKPNLEGSDYQPVSHICTQDMMIWCNALNEILGKRPVYYWEGVPLKNATIKHKLSGKDVYVYGLAEVKDEGGYRLPTSDEWETAARWQDGEENAIKVEKNGKSYYFTKGDSVSGGTFHVWKDTYINTLETPSEDDPVWNKIREQADTYCVYGGYCDRGNRFLPTGVLSTKDVGTKKPNYLGIYDMSGNIVERCLTYKTVDGQTFNLDTMRGGSWDVYPHTLRIGYEDWAKNYASNNHGFRLARTIK